MATEKGGRVADPSPCTSRQNLFENLAEVTNNTHSGSAGAHTGTDKDLQPKNANFSGDESGEEFAEGVDPTMQAILAEQARQAGALQSIEAVLIKLSGARNLGHDGNRRDVTSAADQNQDGGAHAGNPAEREIQRTLLIHW